MAAGAQKASVLLAVLTFASLPPPAQKIFERFGITAQVFPNFLHQIDTETEAREHDGERDHLIYYVLQSRAFTKSPPMEPALSAHEFVESGKISAVVQQRCMDFLRAPLRGERMEYFRGLLPHEDALAYLDAEYRRAMQSLYAKEFGGRSDFYQTRGHSTDTQIAANYAVWNALAVLHASEPNLTFRRVLIVGPGLDFSPRTSLDERFPPQSYQPYAVADALLALHMANAPEMLCADINDRVIHFFEEFPKRKSAELQLFSAPGDPEYLAYFAGLGNSVGTARNIGPLHKTLKLRPDIVRAVSAEKMNILTAQAAGPFDLIIATNVLAYFDDKSLLLALANFSAELKPGGYLIHNEIRAVIDEYAPAVGLSPMHARNIRIANGQTAPLFDSFAIYRR